MPKSHLRAVVATTPPRDPPQEPSLRELMDVVDSRRCDIYEAVAVLETIGNHIRNDLFDGDWPCGVPDYPAALRLATRQIRELTDNMELAALETEAERSRTKQGGTQGSAARARPESFWRGLVRMAIRQGVSMTEREEMDIED